MRLMLACAVVLATTGAATGQQSGYYQNSGDYSAGFDRGFLPDFDQVRQFTEQTPALPGDGDFYCGPTATMDAFAYLANTGLGFLRPHPENWMNFTRVGWDQAAIDKYNEITEALRDLGGPSHMDTNPTGGTGGAALKSGIESWLTEYSTSADLRGIFEVSRWGVDGSSWTDTQYHATTASEIAQYFLYGDVMILRYGFYEYARGFELQARDGGHLVTPYLSEFVPGEIPFIKHRNPSSATPPDTTVQQDQFRSNTRDVFVQAFTTPAGDPTERTVLLNNDQLFVDADPTNIRLLDGVTTISPRGAYARTPVRSVLSANDFRTRSFDVSEFAHPTQGEPVDMELSPDKLLIAAVTGATAQDPALLQKIDVREPGGWDVMDTFATDPIDVCFSRFRTVLVLTQGKLLHYNPYLEFEPRLNEINVTGQEVAMDVWDDTDMVHLYLYDPSGSAIRRYTYDTLQPVDQKLVPGSVPPPDRFRLNPATGTPWILAEGRLFRLTDVGENELVPELALQDANLLCFSFDERGRLFLGFDAGDGALEIHDFSVSGPALTLLDTTPFAGVIVEGCFDITRGRSNLHPQLFSQPGSNDTPPSQIPPDDNETDPGQCPPDLNSDGIVDNGDISAFIALFLAGDLGADFNGDGLLDNGDIAAFVAAFLAGCD